MAEMSNESKKISSKLTKIILSAALAVMPFTVKFEGTVYRAYRDPVGRWTICSGHTKGVREGDVASKETCDKYYTQDMAVAMKQVIAVSPEVGENFHALQAAGDFTMNAGIGAWIQSPMNAQFKAGQWENACRSFSGYWVNGTFSKPQPKMTCRPKVGTKQYTCVLPGLVERRLGETKLCQGQLWFPEYPH